MVYKKYVYKRGRRHGPYYYHSYRDGDAVKKVYIGGEKEYKSWLEKQRGEISKKYVEQPSYFKKHSKRIGKFVFIFSLAILIFIALFGFAGIINNMNSPAVGISIIGYVLAENFSENLNVPHSGYGGGVVVEKFDTEKIDLEIEEPPKLSGETLTKNKNKRMDFQFQGGNLRVYFDLLNYSEFVESLTNKTLETPIETGIAQPESALIEEINQTESNATNLENIAENETNVFETNEIINESQEAEQIEENMTGEPSVTGSIIKNLFRITARIIGIDVNETLSEEAVENVSESKKLEKIKEKAVIEAEDFDIVVNAEKSKIEKSEENPEYKWGYKVKLKDLKFMAKIDITSDKEISVWDEDTLKIENNLLSFSDLTKQGYKVRIEKPALEMGIYNLSVSNISEIEENATIPEEVNVTLPENATIPEEVNVTLPENATETEEANATESSLEQPVEQPAAEPPITEPENAEQPAEQAVAPIEEIIQEETISEPEITEETEQPTESEEQTGITGSIIKNLFKITARIIGIDINETQGIEDLKYKNTLTVYIERDFASISRENSTELDNLQYEDIDNSGDISVGDIIELDPTLKTIEIIKAEHLNENRSFISDIYDYVKEKDENWSETIYNNEYVRVTFIQNLTKDKDITIYARASNFSNESAPAEIEVYVKDNNTLITKFENITEENWHKVYLTNLTENESYDVFDLKILGEVEFDYIVDPTITQGQAVTDSLLTDVVAETGQMNFTHLNVSNTAPYDSLIAYWSFDGDKQDTTGFTAYDFTKYNYNSAGQANAHVNSSGCIYDNCLQLDGYDDFLLNSSFAPGDTNGMTVTFWMNGRAFDNSDGLFTSSSASPLIFIAGSGATATVRFWADNSTNSWVCDTYASSSLGNRINTWVFVTALLNTTGCYIYYNATLIASDTAISTPWQGPSNVYIGSDRSLDGRSFNGSIDEVMYFNTSLTVAQILAIYNNQSSRFKTTGKQEFKNQSILNITSGNNRVNVTTDFEAKLGSQLNLSVGYYDGSWSYTAPQTLTAGAVHTFNTSSTTTNLTLNYTFIAGNSTNPFYSPILNGSIVFDVWNVAAATDTTPPNINFTNPTPNNGSSQANTNIFVNVTANDSASNISTFIDFDNSLVGWWRMDDVNQTGVGAKVYDNSSYGNNGTAVGNAVQNTSGKIGKAFSFDGDGDYVQTGNAPSLDISGTSSLTMSVWINLATLPPTGNYSTPIMITETGYGDNIYDKGIMVNSSGRARFYAYDTSEKYALGTTSLSTGQWYNLVGVYNGTTGIIYVNGILEGTVTITSTYNFATPQLVIAFKTTSGTAAWKNDFNGTIDDVMIFNRSLSAEEIRGLYANTSTKYVSNNFTGLTTGVHTFKAYAQDTGGNVNATEQRSVTISVTDTTYPQFSTYWDNNASLTDSGTALFNVTVTSTNGTVLLEINNTNYTASNLTANVYNVSVSFLVGSDGNYSYKWHSWGNGSLKNYNVSVTRNYTINRETTPPVVYLKAPSNGTITANSTVYFAANFTDNIALKNTTLYIWNSSNSNINTTSQTITGTANTTNISVILPYENNFTWNYYACDNKGNCAWNSTNWTLTYVTPKIGLNVIYPTTDINVTRNRFFNVTVNVSCSSYNCSEINVSLDPEENSAVLEADKNIITTQYKAKINEPVKWKKQIKIEKPVESLKVELPEQAENINVEKIDDKEQKRFSITGDVIIAHSEKSMFDFFRKIFATITGRAVAEEVQGNMEVAIKDNATDYEIEYETPAPESSEKEISEKKKQIIISAPDELNYTNVLAYTKLKTEARAENVKLYHLENGKREEVQIDKKDTNNNGLIDYIEWNVPHLSEQTYELVYGTSWEEVCDEKEICVYESEKDGIKAEIGNKERKDKKYEPHLKLSKWDEEAVFKIKVSDRETGKTNWNKTELKVDKDSVAIDSELRDVKWYFIDDFALEMEEILKKKPDTNVLSYEIETENLSYYYQAALDEIYDGDCNETICYYENGEIMVSRPENVVGSYAVYHSSKRNNEYMAGKAFHIYRPKVYEKNNESNWIWGELNIDEKKGILTITANQDWLDNANYPIVVDPLFGLTANGSSARQMLSGFMLTSGITYSPASDGQIESMTTYGAWGYAGTIKFQMALYDSNGDSFVIGTDEGTVSSGVYAYSTLATTSATNVYADTNYQLAIKSNGSHYVKYDTTATNSEVDYITYANPWVDPAVWGDLGAAEQYTIWANYTASSAGKGGLVNTTAGATPFYTNQSNPRTISLNQSQSQSVVFWVNATGSIGNSYTFFAYANKTSNMLISNITSTWNVSIVLSLVPGVTSTPVISPASPGTGDNLNCSFTVVDSDEGDTLTANVTWYKNNVSAYTTNISVTNNVLALNVLASGNTSVGETWICGVIPYDGVNYGPQKNSSGVLIADTIAPNINFTNPTPSSGSSQSNTDIFVNVTANDSASNISTFIDFDNSLASWWRMDDVNQTGFGAKVYDYTGKNNGTAYGNASQTDAGKLGKGMSFDANGDYVSLSTSASFVDTIYNGNNNWSVAFWLYPNDVGISDDRSENVFSLSNTNADEVTFIFNSDWGVENFKIYVIDSWSSTWVGDDGDELSSRRWVHTAMVWNGTDVEFYTDGAFSYSAVLVQANFPDNSPATVYIGATSGANENYNGTIDDVMIFNRSLSATEISALYANTSTKYVSNNFTGLTTGAHTFKAYAQDTAGNVNATEQRSVTIQSDITTPQITIISPANTTYASSSINFNVSSNENLSFCKVTINNWVTNYTMTLNSSLRGANYTNSSIADGSYTAKFWCNDTSNNINNSEQVTFIANIIPTVSLTSPANGNVTTNRTPEFTWTGSDTGGGPSALTYEINITCWEAGSIVTAGSVYVNKATLGSVTSYIPTSYLKCLSDNNQLYNWTVRAYDGVNYSSWAAERNLSIQSLLTISLPVSSVNFGNMNISDTENTSDNSPPPLVLSNDGNAELNISANFTDLWDSIANPSNNFQFKVRNLSSGCFVTSGSQTSWANSPSITAKVINRLNFTSGYQTGCSNTSVDLLVTVPDDESSGDKSSIITFISSLGEPKQT